MGRWAFVVFVLWTCVTAADRPLFPAEIVSPHGPGPLHFKVGTDVTLQCRLSPSHVSAYDVNKMTLHRASSNETLNVTVIDNATVQATLRNVTLATNEVIFCRVEPGATLAMTSLCIGYAPRDEFQVTCRLRPYVSLQCCVISEQRQDTLCNVTWSMSYRTRRKAWRAFPGQGVDSDSLCATWPLSLDTGPRLSYTSELTVKATAHSQIGTAENASTIRPIRYAVPEPVLSLALLADQAEAHALQVTWERNEMIDDWICEEMELAYVIIATPIQYDDSVAETRTVNVADKCTDDHTMHAVVKGLNPFTDYNVTVIPRGSHFPGPARSRQAKTAQSGPLKAPSIVGWSRSSLSAHSVAVYWKKYRRHDMGGQIVSYEVKVTGNEPEAESATRPTFRFNVSREKTGEEDNGGQLVTAPLVMSGCPGRCVVTLIASTLAGPSPAAAVSIVSPLKDEPEIVVETVRASNESRIVSWEGDASVTSVLWCFGPRYSEDASLINCQTELREKSVDPDELAKRQVLIEAEELQGDEVQDYNGEWTHHRCEDCQWHFALSVSSPADRGVGGAGRDVINADDAGVDSSSDSDVTATAGSLVVVDTGDSDGAGTSRRMVWNRPLVNMLEGPSTTESYTLLVPVTVALALAVIFSLCIACLVCCVRRYRAKAKLFSELDFSEVNMFISRDKPRWEKAEYFTTTAPVPSTKTAPQLDTEVFRVTDPTTTDLSSEQDSLFAQGLSAFESSAEKRLRTSDPHSKSSLATTTTRAATPAAAATDGCYVTTTFAVSNGDQSDEDHNRDNCYIGDHHERDDSLRDHIHRGGCNREYSKQSFVGDRNRDSSVEDQNRDRYSIGDHRRDSSVGDPNDRDRCNRKHSKERCVEDRNKDSYVGDHSRNSHFSEDSHNNEHRNKDSSVGDHSYIGDRHEDWFYNGDYNNKDLYLEPDPLLADAEEKVCLLTSLDRKDLKALLQTATRDALPEHCLQNSVEDFTTTRKGDNVQTLKDFLLQRNPVDGPEGPVEGEAFPRVIAGEEGGVLQSRGGATVPPPAHPEEEFLFTKERPARSFSADSGNCTDYTERPEEGEEGEEGKEEKGVTASERIQPPVSLLRTSYTHVVPS